MDATKKKKLNAAELSDKARKVLDEDGLRYWLFFIYGYMTSRMDDFALVEFERELELLKKNFPK